MNEDGARMLVDGRAWPGHPETYAELVHDEPFGLRQLREAYWTQREAARDIEHVQMLPVDRSDDICRRILRHAQDRQRHAGMLIVFWNVDRTLRPSIPFRG